MALTQVRAKLGDVWTVLTYNETTGRYEGTLTPSGTSANQPGGYYSVEVEATNASGDTATLTGEQYRGLRLVVRETVSPALELVSPPSGYLATSSPVFTFTAQDEKGGSGIDPDSAQAVIDGTEMPCTVTESGGVYTITASVSGLSEGPHLFTVSISDRDGNEETVSAAYTVDTVPPELEITRPWFRQVVDWESVEIAGKVRDATTGVDSVTVNGVEVWPPAEESPLALRAVPPFTRGALVGEETFSAIVPLEVGENTITVTATDKAGQSTTETVWMLRLVTDRKQADVERVAALAKKPWSSFTDDEKAFWPGVVRGAYNAADMNRVGVAVEHLTGELEKRGYAPKTAPKTDWTADDSPTETQTETYVTNVSEIRKQLPVNAPPVPPDLDGLTVGEANSIEANLTDTDRFFPLMELSLIYSGEAFSGEF